LAFAFTDVTTIAILAAALIAVYMVGTYWKHRTLTGYAHWFQENLSKHGRVQFASHGHAGLRVRCETRKNNSFTDLHFALSLGARENLMYYPLAPFTRDFDRIDCWAVLHKPIESSIRILRRSDRKGILNAGASSRLSAVESDGLEKLGYVMFASNRACALSVVSRTSMPTRLGTVLNVESIDIDRLSSKLHLVARLKKRTLPQLLGFIFDLGNSL
jgi:hypothetical protein